MVEFLVRLERPKSILFQFNLRNPLSENVLPNFRRPWVAVLTVKGIGLGVRGDETYRDPEGQCGTSALQRLQTRYDAGEPLRFARV